MKRCLIEVTQNSITNYYFHFFLYMFDFLNLKTLQNRLRQIMDMSQHSTQHETVHLIAHLDELERKLFTVGQQSFKNYKVYIHIFLV